MATGWANDGAVQEQIDATVSDGIRRARNQLPRGESLKRCEECDKAIPQARREALPGVRLCVACQQARDVRQDTREKSRDTKRDCISNDKLPRCI